MPRSKRRSAADMTPSGEEDRSYSSKRLRNSNSSRRVSSSSTHGSMDSSGAGAAATLQQPHNPYHYHHHQQQQQQPLNTTPHHHHHHHQHNPHHHHHHHHSNTTTTSANMVVPTVTATSTPYSQKRCLTWFREYTGKDDPEQLGPDGMEKFCEDIGVEPENVVMLVLAYKMQARRMGYFTKEEWLKGLGEMQCDSIQKLQYRLDYLRQVLNDLNTFKAIYRYAYEFARDKDQRSMDMETAKAMLQLLLGKHWQLYSQFSQFLDQSKYKVINKDQWCNILEFSRTIYNDLSNYDVDGAWPVMLDEFVEWLKASRAAATKSSADIS